MGDWKARVAAKRAELDAAKATITEADREEIDARAELDELDDQIREVKRAKRDADLARRLDEMREREGPDAHLEAVSIQDREDTFIVGHDGKAHADFVRKLNSTSGKKLDPVAAYVDYAVAAVLDWNGVVDFSPGAPGGPALRRFLEKNPGVATSITNVATRLAGAHAEDRKS